jgi:ribosomal protein S4
MTKFQCGVAQREDIESDIREDLIVEFYAR